MNITERSYQNGHATRGQWNGDTPRAAGHQWSQPARAAGIALIALGTTFSAALATRPEARRFPQLCLDTDGLISRLGLGAAAFHLTAPHDFQRFLAHRASYPWLETALFASYAPVVTASGTGGAAVDAAALYAARRPQLLQALQGLIASAIPVPTLSATPHQLSTRTLRVLLLATLAGGTATGLLLLLATDLRALCGQEHGIRLVLEAHLTLPESSGDREDRARYRRISQASATLVLASELHRATISSSAPDGRHDTQRLFDQCVLHSCDGGAGYRSVEETTLAVLEQALISADQAQGLGARLEQDRARLITVLHDTSTLPFQPTRETDTDQRLLVADAPTMFSVASAAVATKGTALLALEAAWRDTVDWLALAEEWSDVQLGGSAEAEALITRTFGAAATDVRAWARELRAQVVPELQPFAIDGRLLDSEAEQQAVDRWYRDELQRARESLKGTAPRALGTLRATLAQALATLSPVPQLALAQGKALERFLTALETHAQQFCVPPTDGSMVRREAAEDLRRAGEGLDRRRVAAEVYVRRIHGQALAELRAGWWRELLRETQAGTATVRARIQGLHRFVSALDARHLAALRVQDAVGRARTSLVAQHADRCFFTVAEMHMLAAAAPHLATTAADGTPLHLVAADAGWLLESLAGDADAQAAASRGDLAAYIRRVFQHRYDAHSAFFAARALVDLLLDLYPLETERRAVLANRLQALAQRAQPSVLISEMQMSCANEQPLTDHYVELPGGEHADPSLLDAVQATVGNAVVVAGPDGADERLVIWQGVHGLSLPMLAIYGGAYTRALLRRVSDAREAPVWYSPRAEQLVLAGGWIAGMRPADELRDARRKGR